MGINVYGYDLRYTTSPVIEHPNFDLTSRLQAKEEINHLSFSRPSNISCVRKDSGNDVHLAVADDCGNVHITNEVPYLCKSRSKQSENADNNNLSFNRILHHDKNRKGNILATSCAFRPHSKTLDIATGGTDCTVNLWDVSHPRRPLSSIFIKQNNSGINKLCNPPIVHCLSWSASGRFLATGLGDGSVSILMVKKRKLEQILSLCNAHNAATACVTFPNVYSGYSSNTLTYDRLLATAGNDGAVLLWDVGSTIAGDSSLNPNTYFVGFDQLKSNERKVVSCHIFSKSSFAQSALCNQRVESIFGLKHGKKPNFLISTNSLNQDLPSNLFLADTSNDITLYTLSHF